MGNPFIEKAERLANRDTLAQAQKILMEHRRALTAMHRDMTHGEARDRIASRIAEVEAAIEEVNKTCEVSVEKF